MQLDQVTDQSRIDEVVAFCGQMWSIPTTPTSMPCSNPCSLMRSNLKRINTNQYWVGEKTDGVRMFLVMGFREGADGEDHEYAVLVDRAFRIYNVLMESNYDNYYAGSLFDGELVTLEDGSLLYVVFDVVAASGYDMKGFQQSQRMLVARAAFENIGTEHQQKRNLMFVDPPIQTKTKVWHPLSEAMEVFQSADHCDGLILVPETGRLMNGTQTDTFKWKEANKHTIDFLLDDTGMLWVMQAQKPISAITSARVHFIQTSVSQPFMEAAATATTGGGAGVLVECECLPAEDGAWTAVPIKIRTDKDRPNSVGVARATLCNILENIGVHELFIDQR